MKKIFLSIALTLAASLMASADIVSPDQARRVAENVLGPATKGSFTTLVRTGGPEYRAPMALAPSYYIFSRTGGGFVIVSGEDSARPVIAYSPDGIFPAVGEIPDNLQAWLNAWSDKILAKRKAGVKASSELRQKWEMLSSPATRTEFNSPGPNGDYLLIGTATWGQNDPFNLYCPVVEIASEKSPTGCVATTLAEYMKYFGYPAAGTGSLPAYTYTLSDNTTEHTEPGHALGTAYNWAAMGSTSAAIASSDSSVIKNVAQLFYDLGVMVQMSYDASFSGSVPNYVPYYMGKYMGYAKNASFQYKYNYSDSEWKRMLKVYLKSGKPLFYSATSAYEGGHAFLIDGYDTADYFHCNWGWDGGGNGFYALDDLSPFVGDPAGFILNQGAVFGMVPDPGSVTRDLYIFIDKYNDNHGITLYSGTVNDAGENFLMATGPLYNKTAVAYSGNVRFGLVAWDGTGKQFISDPAPVNIAVNGLTWYPYLYCRVTTPFALGDRIMVYYETATDTYAPAEFNRENGTIGYYPVYDMPRIALNGSYAVNDVIKLAIDNIRTPYTSAAWTFDGVPAMASELIKLTAGAHTVKVVLTYSDGTTETIVHELTAS